MVDVRSASYVTTTGLRKKEVVDQAFEVPLRVRVAGHDGALVLLTEDILDRQASVSDLMELFLRATVEHLRPDPSPVGLAPAGYFIAWAAKDREHFLRGFAEALAVSIEKNDPEPARAFLRLMARAGDPIHDRGTQGDMSAQSERWVSDRIAAGKPAAGSI